MQIKGEVPRFALIDRDAPKDIMNNEIKYTTYLLNRFMFMFIVSSLN